MQQQHAQQQIREHMEVVGSDGGHVGTVDKVEDGRIKLTKQDDPDGSGQHHHYLSLEAVDAVSGGQVRLGVPAEQAKQAAVGGAAGGGPALGMGTGGLDRGMGARVGASGAGSSVAGNPGLGGGTGNPAMTDGVADLGAAAGPAGMSGDTAPGTISGREAGGVGGAMHPGGGGGTSGRNPGG